MQLIRLRCILALLTVVSVLGVVPLPQGTAASVALFSGRIDTTTGFGHAGPVGGSFIGYARDPATANGYPLVEGMTYEGIKYSSSKYYLFSGFPSDFELGSSGTITPNNGGPIKELTLSVPRSDFLLEAFSLRGGVFSLIEGELTHFETDIDSILHKGLQRVSELGDQRMHTVFEPNLNGTQVPLKLLAHAMGFDGFNWVQTMEIPSSMTAFLGDFDQSSGSLKHAAAIDSTLLDPDTRLPKRIAIQRDDTEKTELLWVPGLDGVHGHTPDNLPFYYNLTAEDLGTRENDAVNGGSDKTTLDFIDSPRFPSSIGFLDGESLKFRTELVGYKNNGEMIRTGHGFTWETNAIYEVSGGVKSWAYLRVDDDNPDIPPISHGGVFNVQQFGPVPEPPSLAVALIGLLGLSISRWKKKSYAIENGLMALRRKPFSAG